MIAHGRKQISEMVYARKASEGGGAVRLQNMIRGAQVVFGGLAPFSPYSGAATGALTAAFPTQWPIIRDYGFSHPEIVPYVNAYATEDPKIAYSLVPTLGKRYLTVPQGSGKGYKNGVTLAYAWSDIGRIDMYFQLVQSISSNGVMLFNRLNGASLTAPYYGVGWNSGFNNMVVTGGTTYTEEGERSYSFTCSNIETYAHMFGWDSGIVHVVRFTHISVYGTDKTTKLMEIVPYIKDGESVCLDLLSGSIIRNNDIGSFTISESPA